MSRTLFIIQPGFLTIPTLLVGLCVGAGLARTSHGQVTNIHSVFGSDACTQITVSWRSQFVAKAIDVRQQSEAKVPYAVAEYGISTKYGATVEAVTFESGAGLQHHAELKGLFPSTTYHYRVRSGDHVGPDCTFRTALPADTKESFTFAIVGDVEGGPDGSIYFPELTKLLVEKDLDFFVALGDLAFFGQQQSGWDGFFRSGASLFQTCVFVPVLGDHGMERMLSMEGGKQSGGIRIGREAPLLYLDQFLLPDNGTKFDYQFGRRSLRGIWYSFDYGSAHIVSMENTEEMTPPFSDAIEKLEAPWVAEDIKKTEATWRFIMAHRAFYPSESESTQWEHVNKRRVKVRTRWDQVFAEGHADLTFGAHLGGWVLSHPIVNGKVVGEGQNGTVHMKLPKLGNYDKKPQAEEIEHWATALPKNPEEAIPATIVLITVHPDRTEVVTLDWPKNREYHRFSLKPKRRNGR